MRHLTAFAMIVAGVVASLALIHFVAPASVKSYLGVA